MLGIVHLTFSMCRFSPGSRHRVIHCGGKSCIVLPNASGRGNTMTMGGGVVHRVASLSCRGIGRVATTRLLTLVRQGFNNN